MSLIPSEIFNFFYLKKDKRTIFFRFDSYQDFELAPFF